MPGIHANTHLAQVVWAGAAVGAGAEAEEELEVPTGRQQTGIPFYYLSALITLRLLDPCMLCPLTPPPACLRRTAAVPPAGQRLCSPLRAHRRPRGAGGHLQLPVAGAGAPQLQHRRQQLLRALGKGGWVGGGAERCERRRRGGGGGGGATSACCSSEQRGQEVLRGPPRCLMQACCRHLHRRCLRRRRMPAPPPRSRARSTTCSRLRATCSGTRATLVRRRRCRGHCCGCSCGCGCSCCPLTPMWGAV